MKVVETISYLTGMSEIRLILCECLRDHADLLADLLIDDTFKLGCTGKRTKDSFQHTCTNCWKQELVIDSCQPPDRRYKYINIKDLVKSDKILGVDLGNCQAIIQKRGDPST